MFRLAVVVLTVSLISEAAVLPGSRIQFTVHDENTVSGSFRSSGSDGLPRANINFDLHDSDEETRVTLTRNGGQPMLHFRWHHRSQDDSELMEHSVLRRSFDGSPPTAQSHDDRRAESDSFRELRSTQEYKALPVLSRELGARYNVTGWSMRSAFALHKFALDAEKAHGTLAKDDARRRQEMQKGRRLKRFDLNPWGTSGDFNCDSPSGKCSSDLLQYTDSSQCNYRGTPVSPSQYASGCYGMCGPGCKNCWTYICGDCCIHPGCTQHDGECTPSYDTFDCLTAKGVLWGTGDSSWHDNC